MLRECRRYHFGANFEAITLLADYNFENATHRSRARFDGRTEIPVLVRWAPFDKVYAVIEFWVEIFLKYPLKGVWETK